MKNVKKFDRLSERTKHGHSYYRARGAAYFAPFGYVKHDDKLKLDHSPFLCLLTGEELSRAAVGRDLVEIFLKFQSLRKTLTLFNSKYGIFTFTNRGKGNKQPRGKLGFSLSGLTCWLNNPILRGHLAYGRTGAQRQRHSQEWEIIYNTHPDDRLIFDNEYLEIERILNYNSATGGYGFQSDTIHPLSGLVYCGECRARCRITSYRLRSDKSIKFYSYQCINYHLKSCTQKKLVRADKIEPLLISALVERSQEIFNSSYNENNNIIIPGVDVLNQQLEQLLTMPSSPIIDRTIQGIRKEILKLTNEFNLKQSVIYQEKQELITIFSDEVFWGTYLKMRLSPIELRSLYRRFCDRIVIKDGKVQSIDLLV